MSQAGGYNVIIVSKAEGYNVLIVSQAGGRVIQCTYQYVLGYGEGDTMHLSVFPRLGEGYNALLSMPHAGGDTMNLSLCPRL